MSVSNLFSKNSYKIYVDDITLKNLNLSSDGNYKIKFPAVVPSGIAPLSVLGVDTIEEGNLIILKWLEPSQSLPFDVINCNILNADQEINCPEGITTLGYMECNICNIKKSGGTEITGFLTSPLQTENNIAYFLPPSRPTEDGQVLSSQINGTMSWINFPTPPIVSLLAYRKKIININTELTSLNPIHTIPYIPNFVLNNGTTYKMTATFSFSKTAGTTFSLYCRVKPITGCTIITEGMGTNATAIIDVSNSEPNNSLNYQYTYWFICNTGPTTWEFEVESGAQAGGVCIWRLIEVVFEPTISLISD